LIDLTLVVPSVWHENGHAEHAESSRTDLKVEIQPVRLTRGGPAKWYMHYYPNMATLLRRLQPDVIHLWEEPWSIVALQASRLRDRLAPNAALVLETDQNIHRRLPVGFQQVRRYTLTRTDLLIARGSEALSVSRLCGFAGEAEFVEYGIDSRIFRPRGATFERSSTRTFRVGYVGRLVPEKGLSDVLEALSRCHESIEFAMLGDGPQKRALVSRVTTLGLEDHVTMVEPCDADGVAEFMSTLDALVLMSRTTRTWKEQFGRVIMEAQACGVPVIGSSSGSIPDVIGRGGWIIPEGDTFALAALLDRLAQAPQEVAAARQAGFAQAQCRFTFSVVSDKLRTAWLRASAIRGGTPA
jgi:glycosyltransferase involved in cell wall biosynthesis